MSYKEREISRTTNSGDLYYIEDFIEVTFTTPDEYGRKLVKVRLRCFDSLHNLVYDLDFYDGVST